MTLNRYLTRLIALCVLPLLLLAIFLAVHHVRGLRAQQHQHAADKARNVASALDQNLGARIGALQVLADSPFVDNPPRLEELYQAAQAYRQQFGGQVVFADLSLQMLFNTRVPFGTPLPKLPTPKGRAAAPTALATGRPAVGDMFLGPVAKEPLVAVVVPVNRGGRTTALLLSVIETTLLEERLTKVALPAQWSLSLRDGTGEVLARLAPKSGVGAIASDSVRSFEARLSASPWVVRLDIPHAVDRAPLITAAAILAVAILIFSLASALGGRMAGRRLARAVASLTGKESAEGTFASIVEVDTARTLLTEANVARDRNVATLRENEERFRATFEQAAVGMAHVALDGRWLRVNRRLCNIVGYEREELLTRSFQDITHPDDLEADLGQVRQVLAGEIESYSMEKRYIGKDGRIVWINLTVSLLRDEHGAPCYFISVVEDIADRKRAETALRASEEQFRAIFEVASIGIVQVDPSNGLILRYNQKFREITGYGDEELRILKFPALTHPDDWERDWELFTNAAQGRTPLYQNEKRYVRRDGSIVWVRLNATFVHDESGRPIRTVAICEDITEKKRTEEELTIYRQRLEEKVRERTGELQETKLALMNIVEDLSLKSEELAAANRELEAFSYSVSHDLKAPLRGIDGYSRLLESDYRDRLDDEGRLFITNIRRGAEQMNQLIEDLLAYSRMERRTLRSVALDLQALTQAVVAERAAEIERSGVVLSLDIPAIAVRADREGLAVVLRNLLENALKFSRAAAPPTVSVGARVEGEHAILWVRDNGIGFDMKFHDRIFEIFQRLQRNEDFPGTGIGLALVRKAMERMNGRVWAESSFGQGATFFLEVPL